MFKFKDKQILIGEAAKYSHIRLISPTHQEKDELCRRLDLPIEAIDYALSISDTNRILRMGATYCLYFQAPVKISDFVYELVPAGVISYDQQVISICNRDLDFLNTLERNIHNRKPGTFIIYAITQEYLSLLTQIEQHVDRLIARIKIKPESDDLLRIFDLQKSLIFFEEGLDSLQRILDQGEEMTVFHSRENISLVRNRLVQAQKSLHVYTVILSSALELVDALLNARLNQIMKLLTGVTVALNMPMIIAGMWGMNVPVPWQESPYGFAILSLACIVSTFWTMQYLGKRKMM